MRKYNQADYENYWEKTHIDTSNDLAAVCFPDKPIYFNRFFDRIQKYIIQKYLKENQTSLRDRALLDIGCGRGRWLEYFNQHYGADVTGIDLSVDAVRECKKKGFAAVQGDITAMPFADSSFDFVSSITVLLHLPYELKEGAVREIARVLKNGGKALLIESTWEDPSPHVFGLAADEWEKLFRKNGLKLIHHSGHCFNLFRRKLPDRIPFRDAVAIHLDYPLEYILSNIYYKRQCSFALQHWMVFENE